MHKWPTWTKSVFAAKTFLGISDPPHKSPGVKCVARCTQGTQQGWKGGGCVTELKVSDSQFSTSQTFSAVSLFALTLRIGKSADSGKRQVKRDTFWVTDADKFLVTRGLVNARPPSLRLCQLAPACRHRCSFSLCGDPTLADGSSCWPLYWLMRQSKSSRKNGILLLPSNSWKNLSSSSTQPTPHLLCICRLPAQTKYCPHSDRWSGIY